MILWLLKIFFPYQRLLLSFSLKYFCPKFGDFWRVPYSLWLGSTIWQIIFWDHNYTNIKNSYLTTFMAKKGETAIDVIECFKYCYCLFHIFWPWLLIQYFFLGMWGSTTTNSTSHSSCLMWIQPWLFWFKERW